MSIPFAHNIDLQGNQIENARFQNLTGAPANPLKGQFYYHSTQNKLYIYNGAVWEAPLTDVPAHAATHISGSDPISIVTTSVNGLMSFADKVKLNGVAAGANNYAHPNHSGDVTSVGDGATTIANKAVSLAKMADLAQNRLIGRISAGAGVPEALTAINDTLHGNRGRGDLHSAATTSEDGFMSSADKTKLDNAVSAPTASRLMIRDASGRAQVAAPSAADDIARKQEVDAKPSLGTTSTTAHRGDHGAVAYTHSQAATGAEHGATPDATASMIIRRDAAGRAKVVDPAAAADIATKAYVDGILGANDAMVFKGTIGPSGATLTKAAFEALQTYSAGWTYKVAAADTIRGKAVEIGDMFVAIVNRNGSGATNADWTVIQTNIDGAVIGPASSIADRIAIFTDGTGKQIAASGHTINSLLGMMPQFKVFTIGNGTDTSFTIDPGLNTPNVMAQVVENGGNFATVFTDVERSVAGVITVRFAAPPASNAYRVLVVGNFVGA